MLFMLLVLLVLFYGALAAGAAAGADVAAGADAGAGAFWAMTGSAKAATSTAANNLFIFIIFLVKCCSSQVRVSLFHFNPSL